MLSLLIKTQYIFHISTQLFVWQSLHEFLWGVVSLGRGLALLSLHFGAQAPLAAAHSLSFPMACGILVPSPGIKPTSPAFENRFFTTAPPGKSPIKILYTPYYVFN